jgi:hypothetical protein
VGVANLKQSLGWITVSAAAGVRISSVSIPFCAIYIFPNKNNGGDGYFGTVGIDPVAGTELEGVIPKPTANGIYQPYTQTSGAAMVLGDAQDYYLKADVLGDKFLVVLFLW